MVEKKDRPEVSVKRNCAILNSNNNIEAWTIFKNVDELYKLRSTIVHGDSYDNNTIERYLPALRILVSRTIIELITLNIIEVKELNDKLTEIGFGDRKKLIIGYKIFILESYNIQQIFKPIK